MIRPASAADAEAIAAIYRPIVLDTAISFETVPPGPAEMERRIAATQRRKRRPARIARLRPGGRLPQRRIQARSLARRGLVAAFTAGSRSGAAATPPDGRGAAGSGVAGRDGGRSVAAGPGYFGCCVIRRYGFGAFQPCGNCFFASSSLTEPEMMTSPPCFQFAGVATLCLAVSWIESMTRRTSSKFRPVVIG